MKYSSEFNKLDKCKFNVFQYIAQKVVYAIVGHKNSESNRISGPM